MDQSNLSAYELERLKTIAANRSMLRYDEIR